MNDAVDSPKPRPHHRKLRFALVTLAVLLAALTAFLFVPIGGRSESMRLQFHQVVTNDDGGIVAWFLVTNAGPRRVYLLSLMVQTLAEGKWSARDTRNFALSLSPGESHRFTVPLPPSRDRWRVRRRWYEEPGRIETLRIKLLLKSGSVFPGNTKRAQNASRSLVQTTYSPEFTH